MKPQNTKPRRPKRKKVPTPKLQIRWVKRSVPQRFLEWVHSIWEAFRYFPGEHAPHLIPEKQTKPTSWLAYSNVAWTAQPNKYE
jgi:hypothetical protein